MTIRTGITALSVGIGLLVASAPARADVITFNKAPGSNEMAVVNDVFGQFLKAHPDIKIETALVDLQGTKVASLAIRFVSPETCAEAACDTAVLMYRQKSWQVVFEHSAATLATDAPAAGLPSDGVHTLVVDNHVRWVWAGFDRYLPDISSLGTRFPKSTMVNGDVRKAAVKALGDLIKGYPQAEITETDLAVDSSAPIADSFYFVSAYAPGLCSNFAGCPHALMMPVVGGFKTLWSGYIIGPGAVMPITHKGLRDIALGTRSGYVILQFNGKNYQPAETSYPSATTPSP